MPDHSNFTTHFILRRAPGLDDEALSRLLDENTASWETLLSGLDADLAKVRRSGTLSPAGKAAEARRLAESTVQFFEASRAHFLGDNLARAIGLNEGDLLAAANRLRLPAVVHVEELKAIETETRQLLRDRYASKPLELRNVLMEAARRADIPTLRAFEFAGQAFPLADQDTLREAAELHASVRSPEKFQVLRDQRRVLTQLETNANQALAQVKKLVAGFGAIDFAVPTVKVDLERSRFEPATRTVLEPVDLTTA